MEYYWINIFNQASSGLTETRKRAQSVQPQRSSEAGQGTESQQPTELGQSSGTQRSAEPGQSVEPERRKEKDPSQEIEHESQQRGSGAVQSSEHVSAEPSSKETQQSVPPGSADHLAVSAGIRAASQQVRNACKAYSLCSSLQFSRERLYSSTTFLQTMQNGTWETASLCGCAL